MAWPQTGILLYKMVCPHLFLGNRLYKMVVHNPFCQHPIRKKPQLPGICGMAWPQTGHPSIKWCTLTFFKAIVSIEWWVHNPVCCQHPAREKKQQLPSVAQGKPSETLERYLPTLVWIWQRGTNGTTAEMTN